jgi:hypothetical protein
MRIAVLAMSAAMTGCITTRGFDCPEPANTPPSVESSATGPTPLNKIITIDPTQMAADGGGQPEQMFEAIIRDPDVLDTLRCRIWIDYRPEAPPGIAVEQLLMRDAQNPRQAILRFSLPARSFTNLFCHRVDLRVSREFALAPRVQDPLTVGDIGSATWWVAAAPEGQAVDMGTCPL